MGITGLLPFLKKASRPANIKEFKGCTVAVDSYCWLHRGAFACADKLALGEPTEQYVYYCMKYVNNLLSYGLKPIMVFDGARLPSKEGVEKERRERRAVHRKKAAQLLREGRRAEARESLQRCVDITPIMALNLMNACRAKGVDCIVAPYEADSQLAYLSRTGIAQVIITEDSDLLLFGCERVMFKMDFAGNGNLIEKKDLNKALDLKADSFTFDIFRYICIISGCDYLPNLPGIGLGKASKLFRLTRQSNIDIVLKKMPTTLKMSQLDVTQEYMDGFHRANNTFLYQLCFDPRTRKLVPLTPYPQDVNPRDLEYAGPYMTSELALQMALGNVDHYSGKHIADFDPDIQQVKPQGRDETFLHMLSIWDPRYRPRSTIGMEKNLADTGINRESTRGKEVVTAFTTTSRVIQAPPRPAVKRPRPEPEKSGDVGLDDDLVGVYKDPVSGDGDKSPKAKRRRRGSGEKEDQPPHGSLNTSPKQAPSPPNRTCLQELKENNDILPEPPEEANVDHLEKPESDLKKAKSPRNKFALHGVCKKNRFNLNAKSKSAEVRSRFFVQSIKLKPKTQFFQSLEEILPSNDPSTDSIIKEEPELNTSNNDNDDNNKDQDTTPHLDTNISKDPGGESLPALPKIDTGVLSVSSGGVASGLDQRSPHGSFAGWSKLQSFKSSFGKASSSIKSSPLTKKQFKPVSVSSVLSQGKPEVKEDDRRAEPLGPEGDFSAESCQTGQMSGGFSTPGDKTTIINKDENVQTWPPKSLHSSQADGSTQVSLSQSSTPLTSKKGCRNIGLSKSSKKPKDQKKGKQQPLLTNFLSKFAYNKKEISDTK